MKLDQVLSMATNGIKLCAFRASPQEEFDVREISATFRGKVKCFTSGYHQRK